MITIFEFALLAAHIYGNTESPEIQASAAHAMHHSHPDKGWAYMTDVDPHTVPNNHFFAQLYLKFLNNKATDAVISVRGTLFNDPTNLGIDILSWYADALGEGTHDHSPFIFTNLLVSFTFKAYSYIRKYFPYISHIKFTGHSLGDALAQLMPLSAGFLGEAVVFNSPGVGNIPGVVKENAGWITNINSSYGIINKIGKRLGDFYSIDVPEMEPQAKQLYADMNLTDYKRSDEYYNLANIQNNNKIVNALTVPEQALMNYLGLAYRLKSYISTYKKINGQVENIQTINNNCNSYSLNNSPNLKAEIEETTCNNKHTIIELNKIITAQHSIDNMITTLQQDQYAWIANIYH